jgi:polyisoprenoid-binding protein YceI
MPRTRAIAIAIAVLVAGVAAAAWYLARDPVAEVDIDAATGSSAAPAATAPTTALGSLDDLAGSWTVVASTDGDTQRGSFVGYRVEEELAGVGATTAVGRTSGVAGAMTIDGGAVTDGAIEADMTRLASDQGFRDRAISRQGLETSQFPTGSFTLNDAIAIPDAAVDGETVTLPATGTLTLHGVSKPVDVDLEARLVDDGRILVVGSVPIAMSDYDITPPSAQRVLSISEDGTAELRLFFERADA